MVSAIREATAADADEIARLVTLLGHASTGAEVAERWPLFVESGSQAFVCDSEGASLKGVLTIDRMVVLHRSRPVGRISNLVVDPHCRGRGIGRALVAEAERHLAEVGCGLIEVTSNFRLTEAHRFYERLGYAKTSVRLAKRLTAR